MSTSNLGDPQAAAEMDVHRAQPTKARRIGLALGPALAGGLLALGPPEGLTHAGWATIAVLVLMAVWWITEAIPIAATALIPLAALPLMGAAPPAAAAAPYANPIIFLFIGGFMIAVAIERWGLHARLALSAVGMFGVHPRALILGFMLAAAGLSAWISNTAAALMLTPIALGVARAIEPNGASGTHFAGTLAIAVAYACSIGGIITPVGSPTNLVAMGYLGERDLAVSFLEWTLAALPLAAAMLAASFALLAFHAPKTDPAAAEKAKAVLQAARRELGPLSAPQVRVFAVFLVVALLWVFRDPLSGLPGLDRLSDMGVAILGALALFLLPAGDPARPGERLLDWSSAERIPWGIALLFGGGLSMAAAMEANGVSEWLGANLGWLTSLPPLILIAALVALTIFLTELASNTATLTALLPVVGAVALAAGISPLALAVPVSIAASFAFMLPIATPPNAIAYASGGITIARMARIGLVLNLVGIALLPLFFGGMGET